MPKRRRGTIGKCPNFTAVPGGDTAGRPQQECFATYKGDRFQVIRYVNGRLSAWWVPEKGPVTKALRNRLPTSTRTTRSMSQLLEEAHAFVNRVRGHDN